MEKPSYCLHLKINKSVCSRQALLTQLVDVLEILVQPKPFFELIVEFRAPNPYCLV